MKSFHLFIYLFTYIEIPRAKTLWKICFFFHCLLQCTFNWKRFKIKCTCFETIFYGLILFTYLFMNLLKVLFILNGRGETEKHTKPKKILCLFRILFIWIHQIYTANEISLCKRKHRIFHKILGSLLLYSIQKISFVIAQTMSIIYLELQLHYVIQCCVEYFWSKC